MRRIQDLNQGPLSDKSILKLFREIMSSCLSLESPLKVSYLGPTTSEVMVQDTVSLIMAFEKIRLRYVSRDWKISYVIHDSQSGTMTDKFQNWAKRKGIMPCLLYTSPSPRDLSTSRMPSSA